MIRSISVENPPRAQWGVLLGLLPEAQVTEVATRLLEEGGWKLDRVAREGLRLLPLRESTRGEVFYLGEIPLVEVRVILQNDHGKMLEGGAALLDVSEELTEAVAVLDALLTAELDDAGEITGLLSEGFEIKKNIEKERAHMRARTRVNFSLLSDADGEESV